MKQKFSIAMSLAVILAMLLTSFALADNVTNYVADVAASVSSISLTQNGATKTVDLYIVPQNSDGKNGCNLTGSTTLVVDVTSSNTSVAIVSPAQMTFTNCEDALANLATAVTVTPKSAGSATVSLSIYSNSTGGTFDLTPASFTVNVTAPAGKSDQTINFAPLADKTYGDPDFTVSATATSGLTVTFVPAGNCTIDVNNIVHLTGAGSCTITASQSGDTNYYAATSVPQSFAIAKATPAVDTWPTASDITYGQALSASFLDGGHASVPGDFSFDAPAATPNAGVYPAAVTFTPDDAVNYKTASGSVNVNVKQAPVTVSVLAQDKTYNGDTSATLVCSITSGKVGSDDVNCSASGSFADANAGQGKTVNISSVTLTGLTAGNYTISTVPTTTTGNINQAPVTVTVTAQDKTYNGTTSATLNCSITSGKVGSDDVACSASGSFADANAGQGKTVNISSVTLTGLTAGNYMVSSAPTTTTGNINKADATCSISGWTGNYDANYHGASGSCSGVGGESAGILDLGATFKDVPGGTAYWTFTGNNNYNDQGGNVDIVIKSWWTMGGFYQPVDMTPLNSPIVWNTVKNGSTVPLKFELFAGSTELINTTNVKSINSAPVLCSQGTEDAIETVVTSTSASSLRYDTTAGQFIFNWKTPSGSAVVGKCYRVTMTAEDMSTIIAYFKLK